MNCKSQYLDTMQDSRVNDPMQVPEEEDQAQGRDPLDGMGIVVGGIAREFNSVLSLIYGYVEMALSELPPDSRARSDLEQVLAAGDRGRELVDRILTFANRSRLPHEAIPLAPALEQVLAKFSATLPGRVRLHSAIAASDARIESHPAELYVLVMNLCENSLQALGDHGGDITVALDYFDPSSEYWRDHDGLERRAYGRLSVKDDGCGMDLGTLEKMYKPFFSHGPGTLPERAGLGLTTVHNIVSAHGGVIYADSEPGTGTLFEVCLPLSEAPRDGVDKPPALPDQSGIHVLFVDDEAAITELATHILEKHGYTVTPVTDAGEALRLFRQTPKRFQVVLTDLLMPEFSGAELAAEISAISPAVPIGIVTGSGERIPRDACVEWGVGAIIRKPFSIEDLLQAVQQLRAQAAATA